MPKLLPWSGHIDPSTIPDHVLYLEAKRRSAERGPMPNRDYADKFQALGLDVMDIQSLYQLHRHLKGIIRERQMWQGNEYANTGI